MNIEDFDYRVRVGSEKIYTKEEVIEINNSENDVVVWDNGFPKVFYFDENVEIELKCPKKDIEGKYLYEGDIVEYKYGESTTVVGKLVLAGFSWRVYDIECDEYNSIEEECVKLKLI